MNTLRGVASFIGFATVAACSDGGSAITGPATWKVGPTNASITVHAIGDQLAAPSSIDLDLDGYLWRSIPVGIEQPVAAPLGRHTIAMSINTGGAPPWCEASTGVPYSARFTSSSIKAIDLTLNCPSLSGSATVNVVVNGTGLSIPGTLAIKLSRANGSSFDDAFTITLGSVSNRHIPPGVYRLTYDYRFCAASGSAVTPAGIFYVVRANSTSEIALTLRCQIPWPTGIP